MRKLYTTMALLLMVLACRYEEPSTIPPLSLPTKDTTVNIVVDTVPIPIYDYDTTQWLEVITLVPSVVLDIKYASTDNFVGEQIYDCGRCFLRPQAARAIAAIQIELQKQQLSLRLFDCYRPSEMQWRLWNKFPDRRYVADPRKGSMHSRGMAVDLTITDANGIDWEMGSPYDFFGREAHTTHRDFPEEVLRNRDFFQQIMRKYGFAPIRSEWWHFSMPSTHFPLDTMIWPCPKEIGG